MAVGAELRSVLENSFIIVKESRDVVPVSFAHGILSQLAIAKYPRDPVAIERVIARYSPMAEYLTRVKTIEEYKGLKSTMFSLAAAQTVDELMRETAERELAGDSVFPGPIKEREWIKKKLNGLSLLNGLLVCRQL